MNGRKRNDRFGKGCKGGHPLNLSIIIKRRHKHIIFFGHLKHEKVTNMFQT
jgi:hypothetical protein